MQLPNQLLPLFGSQPSIPSKPSLPSLPSLDPLHSPPSLPSLPSVICCPCHTLVLHPVLAPLCPRLHPLPFLAMLSPNCRTLTGPHALSFCTA
ncbi:unnamed protein product [Closterium sp. Naga37s-1]|nr:unnamed protein product [Closterium sp. Naga37s-1]